MFSKSKSNHAPDIFNPYYGFVGLYTAHPDFARHVAQPNEVMKFFENSQRYSAPYVYPYLPSDGFERRVIFSAEQVQADNFILRGEVVTNQHPATTAAWLAGKILPAAYVMKDHIQFKDDAKNGHGTGSFTITTSGCEYPNGKPASFAKFMLGVENRPGIFLKIANQNGGFHDQAFMFFPDKATGLAHSSVKNGEAFVLVQEGVELSQELNRDIIATFDKLVKRSYGEHQGLYLIDTHQSLKPSDEVPKSCCSCK